MRGTSTPSRELHDPDVIVRRRWRGRAGVYVGTDGDRAVRADYRETWIPTSRIESSEFIDGGDRVVSSALT